MSYPPSAAEQFSAIEKAKGKKVDIETCAEGFRMTFDTPGSVFDARIDMPKKAAYGPYMINFYLSFYPVGAPASSVVETGLSFSAKHHGWNFEANARGHGNGSFDHPYAGDPLGRMLAIRVAFEKIVPKDKPKPGHKPLESGKITITLGAESQSVPLHSYLPIGRMRLVAAAGDDRGASWSEMSMTLTAVDGKLPTRHGLVEWMGGKARDARNRRMQFGGSTAFGFTCSLPPIPPRLDLRKQYDSAGAWG